MCTVTTHVSPDISVDIRVRTVKICSYIQARTSWCCLCLIIWVCEKPLSQKIEKIMLANHMWTNLSHSCVHKLYLDKTAAKSITIVIWDLPAKSVMSSAAQFHHSCWNAARRKTCAEDYHAVGNPGGTFQPCYIPLLLHFSYKCTWWTHGCSAPWMAQCHGESDV
jgi:hypothetical protein